MNKVDNFFQKSKKNVCLWIKGVFFAQKKQESIKIIHNFNNFAKLSTLKRILSFRKIWKVENLSTTKSLYFQGVERF